MPPASGYAAESSERARAPNSVRMPPTTQTPSISDGASTAPATAAGTMKMPEPMTVPTTRLTTSSAPSTRGSSRVLRTDPPPA